MQKDQLLDQEGIILSNEEFATYKEKSLDQIQSSSTMHLVVIVLVDQLSPSMLQERSLEISGSTNSTSENILNEDANQMRSTNTQRRRKNIFTKKNQLNQSKLSGSNHSGSVKDNGSKRSSQSKILSESQKNEKFGVEQPEERKSWNMDNLQMVEGDHSRK